MHHQLSRSIATLALVTAFLCAGLTAALAGTTGALSGRVVDTETQRPVAGAKVTAASPSGSATASTDKTGSFQFLSLSPDTYVLSVTGAGYDAATLSGITVQADQTATFNVALAKTLKQIGRVRSRSNASLIQPGISTDVYNVSAAQQSAAATLGGGGGLNNAYSAVASVPGVFVPQGQVGQYQSIFVRGANYTQVGYEYDGVPIQRAFDQYPGGNLSNLGTQEVQVYTGSAPTNAGSTALAGFVNEVIRAGTYPGSATLSLGAGSPAGYTNLHFEGGGATPSRSFSYYVGAAGYNQDIAYGDRPEFAQYAPPINVYRNGCGTAHPTAGCYKGPSAGPGSSILGPNGYELGPLFYGYSTYLQDRDNIVNLHLAIPHRNSTEGLKDDVQFLYNAVLTQTYFASAPSDWGPYLSQVVKGTAGGNVVCPNLTTAQNCNRYGANPLIYNDKQYYLGRTGVFLTPGDLTNTTFAYFPNSPANRPLNSNQLLNERDSYNQNGAITKLQYTHTINSRSYARIAGYTEYSDWLQYGEGGLNPRFNGSISPDYKLGSKTHGVDFNYANQLSDKHLLNFTLAYVTSNTFRNNDSGYVSQGAAVAYLVDSTNPTSGVCYSGALAPVSCTAAATSRYTLPGASPGPAALVLSAGGVPITSLAGKTCGSGPCQYFVVATGNAATYNTVVPKFTTVALSDKFQVNERLSLDLGLRYDDFKYGLPDTTGDLARQLFVNNFNKFNCYDPVTQTLTTTDLSGKPLPTTANGINCGVVPRYTSASFSATSLAVEDYPELQPRFGLTYSVNRNNVIRASAGKFAQPSSSAFQQYNTIQPNLIPGPNTSYYNLGFTTPSHHILPEESYNYDASWEHQFNGTDASFKFTPYVRTTKNEISTVLLDPKTNFVGGINIGRKNVKGLEFQIQKGDLNRDGFFGLMSYTYTFARITFDRTPKGTTVVDGLNNAIKTYNGYTSFCASNPTDARCGTTSTGLASAACYKPNGTADAACAAGDIANPYWNAAPQRLFDPNASYPLYNTYSGSTFASGSNQSYIPPHILTFIGNWKHGRLNVTPTAQFQGGAQYGIPLGTEGIDPARGCAPLVGSAATTANDPRYPGAPIAARPYDASSCTGAIPIPNPLTHQYDPYGAFTEPNKLSANLSLSYDLSRRVTARLDFVNVVSTCFGGSNVPWKITGAAGCDYTRSPYVGNFYNPGDVIQARVAQPYGPLFSNVFQSTTAGQADPFQVFGSISIKL
ncbi:MAG: carboxypeptidase regulatory-like domain-containing protein [Candidatus Eremiobacteraeota bacterium]|nr:carboxypeptidase regulatory-like domain-containing protein [Candidatus Eremiobacteraeota bacterium]